MTVALAYILAIVPSLIILYLTINKYGPIHLNSFLICLGLGMLATLPAFQIESLENIFFLDNKSTGWPLFTIAFIFVGLGEELMKIIFLVAFAFFTKRIFDIRSGILYAMVVGMGFALLENIFYAYLYPLSTIAVRSFTAVPAHAVFAIIIGYFVGMAFEGKKIKWPLVLRGLLFASLLHGIYDWLILQEYRDWLTGLAIPVLGLGFFYAYWLIKYADKERGRHVHFESNRIKEQ